MTAALYLAAWTLASIPVALFFGRVTRLGHTPSPCERDAQDGRGEGAEFGPSHIGSNYIQEPINHA